MKHFLIFYSRIVVLLLGTMLIISCGNSDITADAPLNTPPSIITVECPADVTETSPDGSSVVATWTVPTTADQDGTSVPVTVTSASSSGDTFPIGTNVVMITAVTTSDTPITGTCTFNVIVTDGTPPTLTVTCPADVAETSSDGSSVEATWTVPTTADQDGTSVPVTATSVPSPGEMFSVGTTPVTITAIATSDSAITGTCTFNVVVTDVTPSMITVQCPTDVTATSSDGNSVEVTWDPPMATDQTGASIPITTTSTPSSESAFEIGTNVVTINATATSYTSLTDECTFNVIVLPLVTVDCPEDITIQLAMGVTEVTATWTEPTMADRAGTSVSATATSTPSPESTFSVGTTPVTITAEAPTLPELPSDTSLTGECTFNVIVVSGNLPVIMDCPGDIIQEAGADNADVSVSWSAPTATDANDMEATIISSPDESPGDNFPVGTTEITYTFADSIGNQVTCSFYIIIRSTTIITTVTYEFELFDSEAAHSADNPFLIQDTNDISNLATVISNNMMYDENGEEAGTDMVPYADATYRLTADITFSGNNNFTPIGTESLPFRGTFNGNKRSITGLRYNAGNNNYVGLFSVISGATISNLTLDTPNILNSRVLSGLVNAASVGALVGLAQGGASNTINNVTVLNGNIRATGRVIFLSTAASAGGLVGRMTNTAISHSAFINTDSTGIVQGTNYSFRVGGLVGLAENSSITMSKSAVPVKSEGSGVGSTSRVGGLIGEAMNVTITASAASGDVIGNESAGGLIGTLSITGHNEIIISNSYASGNVSANTLAANTNGIGGLVGILSINNNSEQTIVDSYASGDISGSQDGANRVGGLVGQLVRTGGTDMVISNSYISGVITSASGGFKRGLIGSNNMSITYLDSYWNNTVSTTITIPADNGRSTTELQMLRTEETDNLYVNWDTNNWDFGTSSQYPALRNNVDSTSVQRPN